MREQVKQRIDDIVFDLYDGFLRFASFPIEPIAIERKIARCRHITYEKLAEINGATYQEVVAACNSLDGCTNYEPSTGRYLIAINSSDKYNASKQRIRWTTAHELGHIASGHFIELLESGEAILTPSNYKDMEEEADYFAASLLAPIPAMIRMRVKRPADIRDWFGLSQIASEYRWTEMQRISYDIRLEDHFKIFHPHSVVKNANRNRQKCVDIFADPDFIA